jgi:hypothetical protein
LAFRIENCGDGIAVSLPNYHDNFPLAVLVPSQTAITTMCFDISGLHVAAEVPTINLSDLAFTADNTAVCTDNLNAGVAVMKSAQMARELITPVR